MLGIGQSVDPSFKFGPSTVQPEKSMGAKACLFYIANIHQAETSNADVLFSCHALKGDLINYNKNRVLTELYVVKIL